MDCRMQLKRQRSAFKIRVAEEGGKAGKWEVDAKKWSQPGAEEMATAQCAEVILLLRVEAKRAAVRLVRERRGYHYGGCVSGSASWRVVHTILMCVHFVIPIPPLSRPITILDAHV